ncbi:hypothetical protein [Bifidobacterium aquikefiricola]|uniref:Uncharacterized protein n=2 Tax=Bifidobacterium TaxID=1678 RepID=A0AB39U4K8_9BIFI
MTKTIINAIITIVAFVTVAGITYAIGFEAIYSSDATPFWAEILVMSLTFAAITFLRAMGITLVSRVFKRHEDASPKDD